jgi:hypothetical protein
MADGGGSAAEQTTVDNSVLSVGAGAPGSAAVLRLLQFEAAATTPRDTLAAAKDIACFEVGAEVGEGRGGSKDARPVFRVGQGILGSVLQIRAQHLGALKDVLTANKAMELKLRDTTEQIALLQAGNDAAHSASMRMRPNESASRGTPKTQGADGGELAEAEVLLMRLQSMGDSAVEIQRVWRGWLGRRAVLQMALQMA